MAFDKEYFSRQLKSKRALKGWYQDDLAQASGVSVNTIARYENGTNAPSFDAVVQIAKAFDCPTDDFWQREAC